MMDINEIMRTNTRKLTIEDAMADAEWIASRKLLHEWIKMVAKIRDESRSAYAKMVVNEISRLIAACTTLSLRNR